MTFNRRAWQHALIPALIPALFVLALTACDSRSPDDASREQPAPRVEVSEISLRSVDVREEYAGRARGAREVEVRARVDGILEQRGYTEGAMVEQGEQLFRIDPEPFEAAVDSAEAQLQNARANLRQAQRDWDRIKSLYADDAVSTRERDAAQSALELARADVALARAGLRSAEIELGYTAVEAPLDGVTSLEAVPEGSLVGPGDLLTTVTQLDPIHVRFALPERDVLARREARRAMSAGADADIDSEREAVLILPGGERYERKGKLDFTNASIDPDTGTVRARAVFPNPDNRLTPGLFVRVELRTATLEGVAVIPETAVGSGQDGPVVYTVDDAGQAVRTPVELGPVVDAGQVIEAGLDDGDRVVVSGHSGLRDGAEVQVHADGGGESD